MTENIESILKEKIAYKLLNNKNYMSLLGDSSVREYLESILVKYNIRDVDQIYALSLDNDLAYLLELYFLDRAIKRSKNTNFNEDSLKIYYRDMSRYTLLSKEEEKELFTKYSNCSNSEEKAKIKDKIASANLRLVVSVAKDYLNRGFDLSELIAEGNIGLLVSIEKFDVSLGYKFSTYADFWIRQAITRALSDKSKVIRVPVHLFHNVMKVNGYLDNYYEKNGVDMLLTEENLNQIGQDLGLSRYSVLAAVNYKEVMSLDQPMIVGDDIKSFSDIVASSDMNPEDEILYKKQLEEIGKIIEKRLTDREKYVIYYRYGFDDGRPKTLREISEMLGVTGEYVRQIDNKSIQKIKAELDRQDLKYKARIQRGKTM